MRCPPLTGRLVFMSSSGTPHTNTAEGGAEIAEATGALSLIFEIALVTPIGLLVTPPLLILVVVVALPIIAIFALVAAVVGVIAVAVLLVRRVGAHHRKHGSTLFLHRVFP
jgi:hypothetical protein